MSSGKERNDQKFCRSQQQVLESGRTNDLRFNGQELVLLLFHLSLFPEGEIDGENGNLEP